MRRFRLMLLLLALAVPVVPALVVAPPAAAATLRVGSAGKAVKAVQRALGLPADGRFGPVTARAVRRFQRRHGLAATGRVDAVTRRALVPGGPASTGGAAAGDAPAPGRPAAVPAVAPGAGPFPNAVDVVNAAGSVLGVPYAPGGSDPAGFDCSGLVVWSFKAVGVSLPRSSFAQFATGRSVPADAIAAGDLVFFDTGGPGASDVGIATSASTVISATAHGVREHPLFGRYWGEHLVGARRVG